MTSESNNSIESFIQSTFGDISINEIGTSILNTFNDIENNIIKTPCAIPYIQKSQNNINGISTDIGSSSINFSYFIPNLFRSCYLVPNAQIPNICNMFIFINTNIDFYNILIEPEVIKSFLYYNFPCNISSYEPNKNSFINNVINIALLLKQKKMGHTYDATTSSVFLYQSIYNQNSLLTQIMLFYNYITQSKNASDNGTVIPSFNILWEYTKICLCYDGELKNTTILGDKNSNTLVNPTLASFLYTFRVIFNTRYPSTTSTTTIESIINKNNLVVVLNYALEVFQDVYK